MKSLYNITASLLLLLCIPTITCSQTLEHLSLKFGEDIKNSRGKTAVAGFSYVSDAERQDSIVVRERFTTLLAQNNKIRLVERALIDKVFQEQKLQLSGAISSDTIKRISELAGADILISGTITHLSG